jgi:hypothetical protein
MGTDFDLADQTQRGRERGGAQSLTNIFAHLRVLCASALNQFPIRVHPWLISLPKFRFQWNFCRD